MCMKEASRDQSQVFQIFVSLNLITRGSEPDLELSDLPQLLPEG